MLPLDLTSIFLQIVYEDARLLKVSTWTSVQAPLARLMNLLSPSDCFRRGVSTLRCPEARIDLSESD